MDQQARQSVQPAWLSQKPASHLQGQPTSVPVGESGANPHEQRVVPAVPLVRSETGGLPTTVAPVAPVAADRLEALRGALEGGYITELEYRAERRLHFRLRRIELAIEARAA